MIKMKIYKSYSKYGCSTILMAFFVISVQILWALADDGNGDAEPVSCYNCFLDDLDRGFFQSSSRNPISNLIKKTVLNHYKPADFKIFEPCPEPIPNVNDDEKQDKDKKLKWKNKVDQEVHCPDSNKCSVGHFIIKDEYGKEIVRGTVMGCASKELAKRIYELPKGECAPDSTTEKNQEGKLIRNLTIYHCHKDSTFCSSNFCISPKEAEIRRDPLKENPNPSTFGIFSNMAVFSLFLICVFLAVFIIGLALKWCLCRKNICSCFRQEKEEPKQRQKRKHCSIEEESD